MLLLVACSPSAESIALAVCDAVPGLSVDAAGQAVMRDLVTQESLDHWRNTPPRIGLAKLGPIAYGVVRANVECEVASHDGVTFQMLRHEPDLVWPYVKEQVEDLPTVQRAFSLTIGETAEGRRATLELTRAVAAADGALALAETDTIAAVAGLAELSTWFPDPMIRWEVREVERLGRRSALRQAIRVQLRDQMIEVHHDGVDPLEELVIAVSCGDLSGRVIVPNVGPGAELSLESPLKLVEGCDVSVEDLTADLR